MADEPATGVTANEPPMYTTLSKGDQLRASPHRVLSRNGIRIMANAIPVLTLGIMGGAILPVPGAFAQTGAVCSTVFMVLTAAANVYTSDLLFWQAYATRRHDYESLSIATGGRILKHVSIASLLVLLLGTLLSTIQQTGEVMAAGINYINPDYTGIMVQGSGRLIMLISMIVVAPLSLLRELRELEIAGDFGILVVLVLVLVTMINSISHGLPALGNDFPDVGFSSIGNVASSVATYGFIFYLQPISMAMLPEFPQTQVGVRLLSWSNKAVMLGTGFIMYYLTGFFGAARFGTDAIDQGNILLNNLGGGNKQGALNIFFAVYVILAIAPFEFATRHSLDHWVRRYTGKRWRIPRSLAETFLIYLISGGLAILFPGSSAKAITATGATGVCMTSYIIPVVNHYLLYFGKAMIQRHPEQAGALAGPAATPAADFNDSAHGNRGHITFVSTTAESSDGIEKPLEKPVPPHYSDSAGQIAGHHASDLSKDPDTILWHAEQLAYPRWKGMTAYALCIDLFLPGLVLVYGCFCSVAALTTLGNG